MSRRVILGALLLAVPCFAQQSQPPAQQDSAQKPADTSQQPPPAPEKKHTTAQDNPFPEDISKKAAQGDSDAPAADAPEGGKPGSPDYSSSRSGLDRLKDDKDDSRISDGAGGYIHDPKMASQDVKVGSFYLQKGDYQGAYNRFLEATKVDPDNADAVFELAEAAKGLNHKQEAIDNYQIYLSAIPDGNKAKTARKALAELAAKK
ncbi:tetratricopeptide repeat protein [Silvibacterium acidisoli]|uniref:tetratricopeptide repeat protein n=1 Tax=Acidobacteriaceae bacterium ZG23-2 TaxID=2883246 RepID=UPI00406C6D80